MKCICWRPTDPEHEPGCPMRGVLTSPPLTSEPLPPTEEEIAAGFADFLDIPVIIERRFEGLEP